ncbi:hypothetical protein HK104_007682, partial [Borealophlyctis nickersoniae]
GSSCESVITKLHDSALTTPKLLDQVRRESVITSLIDTALTTAELLDQVEYLYQIKLKADDEIDELRTILAERLRKEEFGFRNFGVSTKKLQCFIANTEVFEWFANAHSDVADRMEAGLAERRGTPMSTDERIRQLQEKLEEKDRQIALLRHPHLPHKRVRVEKPGASSGRVRVAEPGGSSGRVQVAEPRESSWREEWNGRDDSGDDESEQASPDTDVVMDDTGGEASVATNTVGVVPEGGNTREEIERKLRAEYNRKMRDEVQREVAIRAKQIARDLNRKSLQADEERVRRALEGYQKNYDTGKAK